MQYLKDSIKLLVSCLLMVICGIIAGMLLLFGVYLLPTDSMKENVVDSADIFKEEGEYPAVSYHNMYAMLGDNFTDALMLTQSITSRDEAFYKAAMNGTYLDEKNNTPLQALLDYAEGNDDAYQYIDYARYWHGYQVVLKPLLMFFDYGQIRVLNGIILVILVVLVLISIWKAYGVKCVIAYIGAVACMSPLVFPSSMQNSTVFYITNFALLVLCLKKDKIVIKDLCPMLFCVVGMMTSYFDFLTYPTVTLGIPLVVTLVLFDNESFMKNIQLLIKNVVCWGIGYAGLWIGKWIVGSLILGQNVIKDAIDNVNIRAGFSYQIIEPGQYAEKKLSFIDSISEQFDIALTNDAAFILVVFVAVSSILYLKYRNQKFELKTKAVLYGIVAMIPIMWYAVVVNHSCIHWFFTFRGLGTFFFAIFMFSISCFDLGKGKQNRNN